MFKFLFGKTVGKAVQESQRQTVERNVEELNGVLALMAEKAEVRIDLNTGTIRVDLPEQMPDEALALPAPDKADAPEEAPEVTAEPEAEKTAA